MYKYMNTYIYRYIVMITPFHVASCSMSCTREIFLFFWVSRIYSVGPPPLSTHVSRVQRAAHKKNSKVSSIDIVYSV